MIATSSPAPRSIHFVDSKTVANNWYAASKAQSLCDVTQFIGGLNEDEKTVLRIAGVLAGKHIRKRGNVDLTAIIEMLCSLSTEWTPDRVHVAITSMIAHEIIVREGSGVQLTRFIASTGTSKNRPPRVKPERERLLHRFERRCCFCHRRVKTGNTTVDHVVPTSLGGVDAECNRALCCKTCNLMKGARTPEQWARDILRWNRPRQTKPRSYAMSLLIVAPAFAMSWLFSILSFAKGGVR